MLTSFPVPENEQQRLAKLVEYNLLDTSPSITFDRLAGLAAQLFNAPIALISLIGKERQFLKAKVGVTLCEFSRETSFCAHAIMEDDILFIPDAMRDPRFRHSPFVVGPPFVRFYAGLALRAPTGEAIGSVCVIDHLPHASFTNTDRRNMFDLAALIMDGMELSRIDHARRNDRPLFEDVATTAPDAILCTDGKGAVTFWNRAAEQLFGFDQSEIRKCHISDVIPDLGAILQATALSGRMDETTSIMTCHRRDGTQFSAEVGLSRWSEGGTGSVGAIVRDITERRAHEERLFRLAARDALTGLPNRAAWDDCLADGALSESGLTLLLFDLDGFKRINDTHGHFAGDAVLKEVGERLRRTCEAAVMVARLGGDEFVCLLRGDSPRVAQAMARDMITAIETPILYDGVTVQVGVSIGISLHPQHCSDPQDLMEAADLALYRAKTSGKGSFQMFTPAMENVARLRRALEDELRLAFQRNEFELFYQPQIRTADRGLAGAEALLRWNHPTRGRLAPVSFIEVLGRMPLSLAVGEWILKTACRDASEWQRQRPDFRISVNLFSSQFRAGQLLPAIRKALADTGLPPSALEVEIVENTLTTQDEPMIKSLHDLRSMGVGLAFDDYGTGFASLSLLKRYPASRLKIDQSFVHNLDSDAENAAVVKVILYLAQVFGMETIAEGIETEEQLAFLTSHGCPQIQGYLFGRPVPAKDFFAQHICRED